jgi:hypothetical protein
LKHLIVLATVWKAKHSACRDICNQNNTAACPASKLNHFVSAGEVSALLNAISESGLKHFEFAVAAFEVWHHRRAAIYLRDRELVESVRLDILAVRDGRRQHEAYREHKREVSHAHGTDPPGFFERVPRFANTATALSGTAGKS